MDSIELRGDDLEIIESIKKYVPTEREDIWGWLCYLEGEIAIHNMSNSDKVKAILEWQKSDMHPLTCENCSKTLYSMINDNTKVVLACDCGYIQNSIPKVVLWSYIDDLKTGAILEFLNSYELEEKTE